MYNVHLLKKGSRYNKAVIRQSLSIYILKIQNKMYIARSF